MASDTQPLAVPDGSEGRAGESAVARALRRRWRLPEPRPLLACGLLAILSGPILFFGLGDYPVINADEAFYHDIAWTMLETGDWFRLRTGGGEHVYDTFANAPLQYWIRGGAISWLGPGVVGMRLHSALAGLLSVWAVYVLVARASGRGAAFLAGLLLLTNYQFVYLHSARTGELETGVTLLLALLALTFLGALHQPRPKYILHHLLLVVLVAWKTPVVPIPLLAELLCFLLIPAARRRSGAWLGMGFLILPLALLWHGYQAWRLGDYLPEVIGAVSGQARGGAGASMGGHAAYYARRMVFGAWPQVTLLPAAIAILYPRWSSSGRHAGAPTRVLLAYLFSVFFFYASISKVGPWYIVHAAPFVAALVALALADLQLRPRLPLAALLLGALGVASTLFVSPPWIDYDPFAASAIRLPMPLDLRGVGPFSPWQATGLVGFGLAVAALGVRRRSGSAAPIAVSLATFVVGLSLLRVAIPLFDLERTSPVSALHADLARRSLEGAPIPLPIEVPPTHPWIAHYYFGHTFDLRPAPARPDDPGPPWQRFLLVAERDLRFRGR